MTYLPLLLSLHRSSPPELLPLIQPLYLLTIRFSTAYTRATMGQGVRKRRLRVLSSRIDRKIYIYIPTSFLLPSLATALPAPIPPTRQNNFHVPLSIVCAVTFQTAYYSLLVVIVWSDCWTRDMFFLNTEFVSSDLHFGSSCEKRGLQLHVFIRLYLYSSLVRVRLVLLYSFRKKVYMVDFDWTSITVFFSIKGIWKRDSSETAVSAIYMVEIIEIIKVMSEDFLGKIISN